MLHNNEMTEELSLLPFLTTNYPNMEDSIMAEQQLSLPLGKIKRICKVVGCERIHQALGYCMRHYQQVWNCGKTTLRNKYDRNEFVIQGDICKIKLYDKNNDEVAEAIIDVDDIEQCKGMKWRLSDGYCKSGTIYLHRHILGTPAKKGLEGDHINRNRLDNKRKNLRWAANHQNKINSGLSVRNKSGFKGVSWNKAKQKWRVSACFKNKEKEYGHFDDIAEAAKKYNEVVARLHGDFAYLNEIPGEQ